MSEQVLHQVFKEWARRRPAALAVSSGGERLTYQELESRANRLAGELAAAGLARQQPVVVLADRGADLVTAQLGTLIAGGAFVCVHPDHPWSRLSQVIDTVAPGAVIADEGAWAQHGERFRTAFSGVPFVSALHGSWASGRTPPPVAVEPGDLAYIAFTSGSTGRPKGIPHRHATLSQFVAWQGEAFGIDGSARVAQLAPQGFDVSYCETFGALCRGASLHVAPEEARSDPGQLAAWLRQERITLLQIVPAHWRALLAELPGTDETAIPDLATVMFVGEALAPSLVTESRERLRLALRLVNVYGPTEVVAATYHEVGETPASLRSVPIGNPIPGREIVLDGETDGVGEICIRSRYLTTGYLGDHEAGERFVPDPSPTAGSGVVYRTGDLARRLPGGELLFVGRADNQVKVRGQRVELEDVEAAIVGTGEVVEAVAIVRAPHDDAQSLVAFVVPRGPEGFDPGSLRRRLAGVLPRYMVPNALVSVDTLPRNPNGKIDRAAVREQARDVALPEDGPAGAGDAPGAGDRVDAGGAPVGQLEQAIAEVWHELLGMAGIGRHADLFSLGGDSLLAMRLISRIRSRLGVQVILGTFFETPTIAGLAAAATSTASRGTPLLKQPVA